MSKSDKKNTIYMQPASWAIASVGGQVQNRSVSNFIETLVLDFRKAHPELDAQLQKQFPDLFPTEPQTDHARES